ncbi:type I polyketide synthase [Frankia sp. AgPm24]|uniref:type I polyketide synthase n=1 Tax=Frankia sp. AgPm24 TaxID=631128 RepID=UPI0020108AB0|nr:type I polyketide synthase [Frankia sp. AgPm24]MCK9921116.1 type I polyketide synthase [Frankia sp. AgPm24]
MTHESHTDEHDESVAVIGVGCRFAGAGSPDAFWDMLVTGRDGIGDPPGERWSAYSGLGPEHAAAVRRAAVPGGFLPDIEGFDSAFFGLTPREAELMDPQQRLLLELAWEALEHAGIPPRNLAGSSTGVFVGIGSDDYGRRMLEDLPSIEAWTGIGSALCAAANRVSYALDLRGPSLAVDTACSASLVATHLACQSLRTGESALALVGGVNLIVAPGLTLTLKAAGATAADGRCKPFDAAADGYGRGEGGGILVLKRLSTAQRDGDRILAVIRGSAVSQDGRTNGIMAPNGAAQRDLLEQACRNAALAPDSVGYVEAHGTGTSLGDPLEAGALAAVYGRGRPADRPCLIGSVKPNIGHLEAGAGVASLIKATLVLDNGEIPPSLNFSTANPAIDWAGSGLRVVTGRTPWPRGDRPRRAGVSGFGYGGTIGHVLLEEAPSERALPTGAAATGTVADERSGTAGVEHEAAPAGTSGRTPPALLFPLSAASGPALREYAGRLADRLVGSDLPLGSVGHTLALRRSHLDHRAALVATDRGDLVDGLRLVAGGTPDRRITTGPASAGRGSGLVWVFSGHGSQWVGMGQELLTTEPAFAAAVDELEPVFAAEIGFSPRKVLEAGELDGVDRIQSMIFVMQVGLAAAWRSYGVTPDAVIGHSVGEIAAAVVCGALTPLDGARLSCRRSRLLRRVAGAGAMAMVSLPFDEAEQWLAGRTDVVAAISASPASTVISGTPAAVREVADQWAAQDIPTRRVASDVAFHSPQMDGLLTDLAAATADLAPREPRVPMYRTALTDPRGTPVLDGAYWTANLRNPVRLAAAIRAAAQDGHHAFLEISPHPVVAHSISETLAEDGVEGAFVGSSLRRGLPESVSLATAIGAAHCHGITVDWGRLQPAGALVDLPAIAWQRTPHWHTATAVDTAGVQHDVDSHTLLGGEIGLAERSQRLWRTHLDDECRPYPGRHSIDGTEIVPAAVLLATFFAAARCTALDDVVLRLPLVVSRRREIQVVDDGTGLRLASGTSEGGWLTHTTAVAASGAPAVSDPVRGLRPADPDEIRRHLASVGVPTMAFGWMVEELLRGDGALRARVRIGPADTWAPVLDAALSVAPAVFGGPAVLRMVARVGRVRAAGRPPATADVEVTEDGGVLDVIVRDTTGTVVARLSGLQYGSMDGQGAAPHELVHHLTWRPLENRDSGDPEGTVREVVLVGADLGLASALRAAGARCRTVEDPADLAGLDRPTDVLVQAPPPGPGESVPAAATRSAWLLLDTAQRLAESELVRLWCVTVGVRESRQAAGLAHSPLWGLGRVLAGEHDGLWGGLVDLPADDPTGAAATLLEVMRAAPGEDVIGIWDGAAAAARLRRVQSEPVRGPLVCRAEGTYLVTGGLGQLGLEVAGWLAERGARRLILASRRSFPARAEWDEPADADTRRQIEGVRALERSGVTVRVASLDVADTDAVARALSPRTTGLPPVTGIVHAAGVLDNRMARDVDAESLRAVLRPKVDGAWALHTVFPPGTLDFFVLFASCGQLLGLPGQATYGAANAFLDALAAHRDDTTSFDWTSWRGQGMAVNDAVDRALRASGVGDVSAPEAFAAWDFAARRGAGQFAVLRAVPLDAGTERGPLLRDLSDHAEEPVGAMAPVEATGAFAGLPPAELRDRLLETVGAEIAGEMRLSPTALDFQRSLVEQGLDSVMTIIIRRRLEKRFGHRLPTSLLWHEPSVVAITNHLVDHLSTPVTVTVP